MFSVIWNTFKYTHTPLTSSIHDSQHDGGDPGHLTGRGIEDDLDLFEEHRDGFGEGVGEADGDEGPHYNRPAPAPFRRGVPHGPTQRWRHVCSRGEEEEEEWRTAGLRGEEEAVPGALRSGLKTCGRNRAESW